MGPADTHTNTNTPSTNNTSKDNWKDVHTQLCAGRSCQTSYTNADSPFRVEKETAVTNGDPPSFKQQIQVRGKSNNNNTTCLSPVMTRLQKVVHKLTLSTSARRFPSCSLET